MTRAVILFGHGSRDPGWRGPMDAVAAQVRARGATVSCAFLELQAPGLPQAVAEAVAGGATTVRILPMFLGIGKHAREDLPALVAQVQATHPGVRFELLPAVGEDPRLIEFLARLAVE